MSVLLAIFRLSCLFFLLLNCMSFLEIKPLLITLVANIFSHSVGYLFILFIVSLVNSFYPPPFLFFKLKIQRGTSLAVQWLRLPALTARGAGSIPGRGTKILHATWPKINKLKIKILFF